ncbi:amino acid permease [Halodesulfovibrio spirochaetisodalis]|uniref:Aromatic amino acid permease n=1 Tax=Halodesulfovibrio spirochaetisodalis TaxID=1560234 RepID=A0A1B7XAY5_9BACT|nr:aromatic amino acid transport family protein [Halodesulfovibrio spirochaetisodalis]OBQ46531.1 aromatic amino acid permease [Halodesulfovibrio spirochaetisodalis]
MLSKNLGAISIVAGTSIGAGMLGLPMAIGSLGFVTGTLVLLFMWLIAMYVALLLLEINIEFGTGVNLNFMTRKILGRPGQLLGTGSVFFLFYCLLVAYLTGMGGIIANSTGLDARMGTMAFAGISALLLFSGTNSVVTANKYLFIAMLVGMVVSFATLGGQLNVANLAQGQPKAKVLIMSLPVLFTSFGYHPCIPSIVNYVGDDKKTLIRILAVGSTIPFICYFAWLTLALGSATPAQLATMDNVDILINQMSGGSSWVTTILSLFASLALITSFIGVSFALFDLVAETFRRKDDKVSRAGTTAIVFIPPLAASLLAPNGFIAALAHAGAAFTIIAVFIPCVMAWKMRSAGQNQAYRVFGGKAAIAVSFLCGLVIVSASYM